MIEFFAAAGGLFALLTFIHFFGDWLFQSQYEATNKSKNTKIRALHCTIYTAFFVPMFWILGVTSYTFIICVAILWVSHFVIDTYIPVILWAHYLRKIPELKQFWDTELEFTFIQLWKKPVYPILFITVDQILHLTFLWPIVFLILL